MPRQNNIQFRKGSSSQWISQNPTLASGEPGYDLSNKVLKIGDGTSNWIDLSGINQNIVAGYDISVTNNSGIYTIASTNLVHTDSQQPQGFVNRTDSRISVSGNIFRIEPTGSSYSYYNKGIKVVKTSGDSLTIPNLTQINYIHFDTINNQLSNKTTSFDFSSDIPIAYVAWNSGVGPSGQMTFFAEERHGIVMDTSTHKWIHYTFGAQYIEGLSISDYVLGGNGSSNSHATISIGNGTLYQEDIEINITDSSSSDPFCQELSPIAQIPVYYHQGTTGQWVKNTATNYPVKYGANGPQYNLLSGGTWSTPDVSPGGAKRYFAVWILATNQIDDPIISIMGQRVDSNQGSAENNNSWGDVNLTNLPLSEVKPLYRLIFAGDSDYTNVPKCALLSILDIRVAVISTIAGVTQNDHGNLFGLGDDDHSQYLHVDNNRTVNAVHNFVNGINLTNNQGTLNVINDSGGLSINFGGSETYNFSTSVASIETNLQAQSGNFTALTINNTGVSLSGHTHTVSNITNFNSSVSGLLPVKDIVAGNNITVTSSSGTYTINATAAGGNGLQSSSYISQGKLSANQLVTSGGDAVIQFVDDYDPQSWFDATTRRFQPNIAGYYLVSVGAWMDDADTTNGQANVQIRLNGNTILIAQNQLNDVSGLSLTGSKVVYLNGTTDYVDFTFYHSTGSSKNLLSSGNGTWFTAVFLAWAAPPIGTQNYISKFGTSGSGVVDSLIFDNGTNVGIGTNSPSSKLHIYGDIKIDSNAETNTNLIFNNDGSQVADFTWDWTNEKLDINSLQVNINTENGLVVETISPIQLNPNGGGNVGIGTSSPGSPLTIATAGGAGTIAGASQTQIFQVNDASASDYVNLGHFNCESNLSRGSFMLSNNGNGAWQDNCLQFFTHGANYGYGYYAGNLSDAGCAMIVTQGSEITKLQIGNYNAAPIELFTDNTVRMIIDSGDGNVGIGTATPLSALHVNGDITCDNIIPSDPGNTFFRVGTSSAYLDLNIDNLGIGTDGDIGMVCGGNINLTPDSAAAIYLNGNVNIDGNLTFDSYTESVVANGNSGASKTLSLASGTVHTCTLTGNCTFTMPTATAGKSFSMFLNSGSGNYTASFSGVRWADSAIPTATITTSKVDIYSFISDGSFWYGSFSQNYG